MDLELPPRDEALRQEDVVVVRTGATDSKILTRVLESPVNFAGSYCKEPKPEGMSRVEGEYRAIIKGLRKALKMGYTKAILITAYEPITGKLWEGYEPIDKHRELHGTTFELVNEFDKIDVNPKPWHR